MSKFGETTAERRVLELLDHNAMARSGTLMRLPEERDSEYAMRRADIERDRQAFLRAARILRGADGGQD
jgi:hypothetical protein